MTDYIRIRKECFWDLNISEDDIKNILNGSDLKSRSFLFEKLLLNSTKLLLDLELFKRDNLRNMLENFKIDQFNKEFLFRRKNISEAYFFDKPLQVGELQWPV